MRDSPKPVRAEVGPVEQLLTELGVDVATASGGVVASGPRAAWLREGLQACGITTTPDKRKKSSVRIAAPDDEAASVHLLRSIRSVLKPDDVSEQEFVAQKPRRQHPGGEHSERETSKG